jgi:hypothetical protein
MSDMIGNTVRLRRNPHFGGKIEVTEAENDLIAMFEDKWRLQRPGKSLHRIAIVDIEPSKQF